MKKYYQSSNVRNADKIATDEFGLPGFALMENAGRGAAEILLQKYPEAKNFLILCGSGNNGGDGFVTARHLAIAGRASTVVATIGADEYKNDAAIASSVFTAIACPEMKSRVFYSKNLTDNELSAMIRSADVTVDALLGTGSSGALRGEVGRLARLCAGARRIVSLDIPSGVNPDTGEAAETAITAEMTLTFLAEKPGLAVSPGSLHSGEVHVCGIGFPPELALTESPLLIGYDKSDIPLLTPEIPRNAHKGTRGALMIVGGCDFFRGAPVLAALGALRAGCGLVFLAVPDFMVSGAATLLPEAIFVPLGEKGGSVDFDSFERSVSPWLDKCDALVCGPGLGSSDGARKTVEWLCREWSKPLLLDADALRHAADMEKGGAFRGNFGSTVITPHEGEAAYMLGADARKISGERLSSCAALAEKFGVALLKGPNTLICRGAEKRVILGGGPQLAIPGSGDVLSGIIGAFLAAGMPPVDAATLGALIHVEAGNRYNGISGLLARELANNSAMGEF